jgi:hypothetical protein
VRDLDAQGIEFSVAAEVSNLDPLMVSVFMAWSAVTTYRPGEAA